MPAGPWCGSARTAGRSIPGRIVGRALRVHRRGDRRRSAHSHPLAPRGLAQQNRRAAPIAVLILAPAVIGVRRNETEEQSGNPEMALGARADRRGGRELLLGAQIRGGTPSPYGTNDAGGFRNVLPPGENGLDTARPAAAVPGRRGLSAALDGSAAALQQPDLRRADAHRTRQIGDYFKDATFGVKPGEVESTTDPPGPGVTIVRDKAYGIPTSTATRAPTTMFGAGYASAADRLFLMDVLRHTGKGRPVLVPRRVAQQPGDGL